MALTEQQKREVEQGERLRIMRRRELEASNSQNTWSAAWIVSPAKETLSTASLEAQSSSMTLGAPSAVESFAGETIHAALPGKVKIYPEMALKARASGHRDIGAWRIWAWAKASDIAGSGAIGSNQLRNYVNSFGYSARTIRSWIQRAREIRLIKRCGPVYVITGYKKAALIFGITEPLAIPCIMDAGDIAGEKSMANIWSAYLKRFDRPISKARLTQITGVSARQQFNYEKTGKVEKHKNFSQYKTEAVTEEQLEGVKHELGHNGAFIVRPKRRKKFIYIRLPDTRRVTLPNIEKAKHGRTRKINKALRGVFSASLEKERDENSSENNTRGPRLFYDDHAAAERSVRRWGRNDQQREVREVFSPISWDRRSNTKPFTPWELTPNWSVPHA